MPEITVPYHYGLVYGVGVDTPSGEARNIAATGESSEIRNATGDTIDFYMNEITSVEDLHTELGISASASGGFGLFSASARFDYAKNCNIHRSHVFLFAKVSVIQAFSMINAPGIKDDAKTLLEDGNMASFQDQYGDMFVRGLVRGGLFFATIQIFCKDETEKESIKAKVSASYAAISGSVQFDTNFQQTLSEHSTKVSCHIEGGDPAQALPVTVKTMMDRAIHFPGELKDHGVVYAALLDSYSILPLPNPPNYIDLQNQKDVLTECAHLRDQDLMELNDIDYITQHPDEFIDVNTYPLSQLRNDLNDDLHTIATAASKALDHPKDAKVPDLKQGGPIDLPKRKAGLPQIQVKVPNLHGLSKEEAQQILLGLGLQCVVNPYGSAHGAVVGHESKPPPLPDVWLVMVSDPPAGSLVAKGSTVWLSMWVAG